MRRPHFNRSVAERGFTFVELVIAVGIVAILASAAVMVSPLAIRTAAADSSLQAVVKELREAREQAIADRRNILVEFLAPNQIRITRRDVDAGVEVGTTVLETVTIEGRLQFGLVDGVPDTPDGFGNGTAIDFAEAESYMFTSEGSFVDQTGDPLNGTVFLAPVTGDQQMARAVTIFGPTALVRGYRWNGAAWTN